MLTIQIKLVIVTVITAIAVLLYLNLPPDMDIFSHYHALACMLHPLSKYDTFRAGCSNLTLTIAGFIPWPRNYYYGGFSSIIPYGFLRFLLPFWQSGMLMSVLWAGLALWALVRLTAVNAWIASFLIAGNFLFAFNAMADIAWIMPLTALLFIIPCLIRASLEAQGNSQCKRWLWLQAALAMAIFYGTDVRPMFMYYLVGCSVFVLLAFQEEPNSLFKTAKRISISCAPAMALTTLLLSLLFFARTAGGWFYWKDIAHVSERFQSLGPYWRHVVNLFTTYMLQFPNSGGLFYGLESYALLASPMRLDYVLLTLPFWVIALFIYYRYSVVSFSNAAPLMHRRMVRGLFVGAIVLFLVISLDMRSRHGFYIIPATAYMLAALTLCTDYLWRKQAIRLMPIVVLLGVSQIICTFYVVTQKPVHSRSWDRIPILNIINQPQVGDSAVIVHLDWGTYFISALFGAKNQIVTYNDPIRLEELRRLKAIAQKEHRALLFVKLSHRSLANFEMIKNEVPDLQKIFPTDNQSSEWEAWAQAPLAEKLAKNPAP